MENAASSSTVSYLDWTSWLLVFPEEEQNQESLCGLPDIGGHIMKIPLIAFQVLLCMRLEVNVLYGFLPCLLVKIISLEGQAKLLFGIYLTPLDLADF